MHLLTVSEVRKQERQQWVLKGVSFTQEKFQKIAIAGESGSGKSTLLRIIGGLTQRDEGEVSFEGESVKGPFEKLIPGHPGIAYLSQHFELHNNYRVEDLLSYKNLLSDEEAATLFSVCRISHLLQRRTDQLSGGERQRIALARLLTGMPRLLLLDEPFSNLDLAHTNILKSVIGDLGEKWGTTVLLVSHDPPDILSWADMILIMKDGMILQHGTPHEIYRRPVSEYAAGLFGKYNLLSSAGTKAIANLTGVVPTGPRMLIRPEDFKIVAGGNGSLSGKVTGTSFFGSYSEIEVRLPQDTITIRVASGDPIMARTPAKDKTVFISLAPDGVWYV
ncbi:MAG TPA: ABC transporter ATP-binding protein [Puia sp.]|nr:ABC transporter ATP-binding protein [Puia sp.]